MKTQKDKAEKSEKKEEKQIEGKAGSCNDKNCPFHGELSVRGRVFEGNVVKKFHKRIVIAFERVVYIPKYERYAKSKTRLHARLPDCLYNEINVGDYVRIQECRPLSKIIKFVVVKKIK